MQSVCEHSFTHRPIEWKREWSLLSLPISVFLPLFLPFSVYPPLFLSLTLSSYLPLHPASVTPCELSRLSILICSFFISLIIPLFQQSPLPHLALSFSLQRLTYLQHSCLMNNGAETVTISISISGIPPLISAPFPSAFPRNSPVSPCILSLLTFSPLFMVLWTVCSKFTKSICKHCG